MYHMEKKEKKQNACWNEHLTFQKTPPFGVEKLHSLAYPPIMLEYFTT